MIGRGFLLISWETLNTPINRFDRNTQHTPINRFDRKPRRTPELCTTVSVRDSWLGARLCQLCWAMSSKHRKLVALISCQEKHSWKSYVEMGNGDQRVTGVQVQRERGFIDSQEEKAGKRPWEGGRGKSTWRSLSRLGNAMFARVGAYTPVTKLCAFRVRRWVGTQENLYTWSWLGMALRDTVTGLFWHYKRSLLTWSCLGMALRAVGEREFQYSRTIKTKMKGNWKGKEKGNDEDTPSFFCTALSAGGGTTLTMRIALHALRAHSHTVAWGKVLLTPSKHGMSIEEGCHSSYMSVGLFAAARHCTSRRSLALLPLEFSRWYRTGDFHSPKWGKVFCLQNASCKVFFSNLCFCHLSDLQSSIGCQ